LVLAVLVVRLELLILAGQMVLLAALQFLELVVDI
jgi:hypothetical protein